MLEDRNLVPTTEKQNHYSNKGGNSNSKGRWLSYAAAGAAAIAAGQQADAAKVVDMGNLDLTGGPFTLAPDGTLALDLDNNGSTDVTIYNYQSSNFSYNPSYGGRAFASGSLLGVFGQYNGSGGQYNYAINFSRVSSIGPQFTVDFVAPRSQAAGFWDYTIQSNSIWYMRDGGAGFPLSGWNSWYPSNPQYGNNVPGFLGVRFDIGGNTHYGFVELEIDLSVLNGANGSANVARILSYGYEDVPDAQISGPGDANFVRNDALNLGDDPNGNPIVPIVIQTNWLRERDYVDGRDFLQLQRGIGAASPSQRDGDANRDGVVDDQDVAIWESQYGEERNHMNPPVPLTANVAAVPEPTSLGLLAFGAAGLLGLREYRSRRKEIGNTNQPN